MVYFGFILTLCPIDRIVESSAKTSFCEKQIPFAQPYRYCDNKTHIRASQYSRRSVVIDHYEIEEASEINFHICISRQAHTLISIHEGDLQIKALDATSTIALSSGNCCMIYCAPGNYSISLSNSRHHIDLISITPDLMPLLHEEFEALQEFEQAAKPHGLYHLPILKMDKVYNQRLQLLLYPKVKRAKDYNAHLLHHLLRIISAYKGLSQGRDQQSYDKQKLLEICDYIKKELREHFTTPSVANIAQEAFISHDKMGILFRNLGMTPKQFILQEQMKLVAQHLIDTPKSIALLAEQFHFSDSNSLIKSFKSVHGITPGAYREKHR